MNSHTDLAARALRAGRNPRSLARGLGWFSLALGAAELVAPRSVARAAGIEGSRALVRLYGLREIACGVGILLTRHPASYVWARVGGDIVDVATVIGKAGAPSPRGQARTLGALANLLGITALDVYTSVALRGESTSDRERQRDIDTRYRGRSGFPRSPQAMRGVARRDFAPPRDTRTPQLLRPWIDGKIEKDTA